MNKYRMPNRNTRKVGGLLSAIKKGIYGSKSPKYKMDVTAGVSYDKDMYEIAGTFMEDIGQFAGFRTQNYIDIYLKRAAIDVALKKHPNARRVIGYNTYHVKSETTPCFVSCSKGGSGTGKGFCPGTHIISGVVLQPKSGSVTRTRSRSKSRSPQ